MEKDKHYVGSKDKVPAADKGRKPAAGKEQKPNGANKGSVKHKDKGKRNHEREHKHSYEYELSHDHNHNYRHSDNYNHERESHSHSRDNEYGNEHNHKHSNTHKLLPVQLTERKPISNCYVFAKVMESDSTLCKMFAEWIIGEAIGDIGEIIAERVENTVLTRSVRFDTCLEGSNTFVDIEMQTVNDPHLAVRMAHYLSWLTTHALDKGKKIKEMPKRYVIFVCTFDPIGDADPIYKISNFSQGTHLRSWDDGGCAFIVNTKGDLSRTEERIAEVLKYIDTEEVNENNEVVIRMRDGIDKAYSKEDWTSDMNGTDFDRLAWKEEGIKEGLATGIEEGREEGLATGIEEGQSAERTREAALLKAMCAQGCSLEDFATAIVSNNRDKIYQEYGIE